MTAPRTRRIAVVTGSRADFGLLCPVIRAIDDHPDLELRLIAAGAHYLPDHNSITDVAARFDIAVGIRMQEPGRTGRIADARALAHGIAAFTDAFESLRPDVVLVLGDRIEAFAAGSAASVGGYTLAHIHGGDRAEGVADEAMRHALSHLAHLHFAATHQSAQRLQRMGLDPDAIFTVGSPAIDGLTDIPPAGDADLRTLGLDPARPFVLLLHHPTGLSDDLEHAWMAALLRAVEESRTPHLILAPNHDPGRPALLRALGARTTLPSLPRERFIALLRRAAAIVGNSSAGLIEAAALAIPAVNLGPRQAGRERPATVIDVAEPDSAAIAEAIAHALRRSPSRPDHPYGDGRTGPRIADLLASLPLSEAPPRKRLAY